MVSEQMTKTVGYSIEASLSSDFTFTRWDGQDITLPRGKTVRVDAFNGIAYDGEYHFSVESKDYTVQFPN